MVLDTDIGCVSHVASNSVELLVAIAPGRFYLALGLIKQFLFA